MNIQNKNLDIAKTGNNLVDVDAIMDSIWNIISILVGEVPFNRSLGSRVEYYLFQPLSFSNSKIILSEIVSTISRHETRVNLLPDTNVVADYDNRKYEIVLNYEIIGLETPFTTKKSISLKGESND
jgi:phage baseplate assembly protein W